MSDQMSQNQASNQGEDLAFVDRLLRALSWGTRAKIARAALVATLSVLPAAGSGYSLDQGARKLTGYSEEAHGTVRRKYEDVVTRKRAKGIEEGQGPYSIEGWMDWLEQMKKHNWDITAWAAESEPFLKQELKGMDRLQKVHFYNFLAQTGLSFLLTYFGVIAPITRRVTRALRPGLLERELAAQGQSLEKIREQLTNLGKDKDEDLAALATTIERLMARAENDPSKLRDNEIELLRISTLSAVRIIRSLKKERPSAAGPS